MQRVILGQCQAGKVIVYCDVVRPGEVVVCGLVRPVKDGPADNILQNLYSPLCVPKIPVYCCFHNTIVGRCTEKCETIKNTGLKKKKKHIWRNRRTTFTYNRPVSRISLYVYKRYNLNAAHIFNEKIINFFRNIKFKKKIVEVLPVSYIKRKNKKKKTAQSKVTTVFHTIFPDNYFNETKKKVENEVLKTTRLYSVVWICWVVRIKSSV